MKLLAWTLVAYLALCQLVDCDQSIEDRANELLAKYEVISEKIPANSGAGGATTKQGWLSKLFGSNKKTGQARDQEIDSLIASYGSLNDELARRLPGDKSVEANFKVALDWYKEGGKADPKYGPGLEQLVALANLGPDSGLKCSQESELILRLNERLTRGRALSTSEMLRNRVDNIVRHFLLDHEKSCRGIYEARFEPQLNKMGSSERDQLFQFLSDSLMADFSLQESAMVETLSEGQMALKDEQEASGKLTIAQYLAKEFKNLAFKNKKANFYQPKTMAVDEKKFNKVFDSYLASPCKSYVKHLGPNVYGPWSLDMNVADTRFKAQMTDSDAVFALGWTRFEICNYVVKQADTFKSRVKEILMASQSAGV